MKKIFILMIVNVLTVNIFSQNINSMVSYSKGVFTTNVSITVNASENAVNKTVTSFLSQYANNLNMLFGWALKDVNLQGETDKFMIFNVKSHQPENGIIKGKMDMSIIPLNKKYTDVAYNVKLTKIKDTAEEIVISYKLYDCEEVIKAANATLKITRKDATSATIVLIADVRLTGFYNMLITKKMYEENMKWRFVNFVKNLANDMAKQN